MRPAFIMAEREPDTSVSARKLVLEAAKFNVITAHSGAAVLETIAGFRDAAAVILVDELPDTDGEQLAEEVKRRRPGLMVIALGPTLAYRCTAADHSLSSHDPEALLQLVRSLFGEPRE